MGAFSNTWGQGMGHKWTLLNYLVFTVAENQTAVGTITETDATFSLITGSADFNLNTSTGVITFKTAPNYEIQSTYSLKVQSSKGKTYVITVYVTDAISTFALNLSTVLNLATAI